MTIEEMRTRKQELGYSYKDIAMLADLPLSTVQKILGGITERPRRETILKLEAVLRPSNESFATLIRETPAYYGSGNTSSAARLTPDETDTHTSDAENPRPKKPGEYTIEDYAALPEDQRVELIDGVFYDMNAPFSPHQLIAGAIYTQLANFIAGRKGSCIPFIAPFDVQLDCDNRTMVQPDVGVICNRSKLTRKGLYGAPDFIVEVLSPSTRKKDMSLKLMKYTNADVREYWLVDPDARKIIVYDLEHLDIPRIYDFSIPVPVMIWNGECLIDLGPTGELLDELFPEGE